MNDIRWGIIGTGKIAHTFAEAINNCEGCKLTAVSSRNLQKAEDFAEKFDCERAFGSYLEMAECNDVDVVYIATPMSSHFRDSLICLGRGKNVLCEKSVTLDSQQLVKLLDAASEKGLFFMEAMWMKCQPAYLKAKEWIKSGRIGDVEYIKADFSNIVPFDAADRLFRADCGGGALLDLSVYPISLAEDILPDTISEVVSFAHIRGGIDLSDSIVLKTSEGSFADISAGFEIALSNNAVVVGSEGSIVFGNWFHCTGTVILYDQNRIEAERFDAPNVPNSYVYEVREVNRCIREKLTESPLVPHNSTVSVMKIMDECRKQWGLVFPTEAS